MINQIIRMVATCLVLCALALAMPAEADPTTDSTSTTSTTTTTNNVNTTYTALFSTCLTCGPVMAVVTQGYTLAAGFFASYAPIFAGLISGGLAIWILIVAARMMSEHGRDGLTKEFLPTMWKASVITLLLGGTAMSASNAYALATSVLFTPTIDFPLAIASDMLANKVPTTAVTTNSHNACVQAASSSFSSTSGTASGLAGPLGCVVYTAEESASWIVTIGLASIGAGDSGTGIVATVKSVADKAVRFATSPISFVADLFLVWVAGRAFLVVAWKLLVNYAGFCVTVFFLPVALFLWVFPPTKGALRKYIAALVEHGVYFIGLAIIAVILPAFASSVIAGTGTTGYSNGSSIVGIPTISNMLGGNGGAITSVTDLFNLVNSFGQTLSPLTKLYWVLMFISGGQNALFGVPENIAQRMSKMIAEG